MAFRFRCAAASLGKGSKFASISAPAYYLLRNCHGFSSNTVHRSTSSLLPLKRTGYDYSVRATQGGGGVKVLDPVGPKEESQEQLSQNWKIKMLYDGECPLCMREVMGRIHAILSDGTVVTDVEAFIRLYEAVGLGWVCAITKYEPIETVVDAVYGVWAKYRLQITGRPPLEQVLEARKIKRELCSDRKTCKT